LKFFLIDFLSGIRIFCPDPGTIFFYITTRATLKLPNPIFLGLFHLTHIVSQAAGCVVVLFTSGRNSQ
jgi:hypothetical protein